MSQYFISLSKIYPPGDQPFFVGPFSKEDQALKEIEKANQSEEIEVVTKDKIPNNAGKALLAEIYTKTEATRNGLRFEDSVRKQKTLVGLRIPSAYKYLFNKNGYNKVEEPIMEEQELDTIEEWDQDDHNDHNYNTIYPAEEIVDDWKQSEAVIVTKFPSNVEWLRQHGIYGDVRPRVYPDQIRGKHVVGTLPYRLGVEAEEVGVIDLPNIPVSKVGLALNTTDLYDAGATLEWYKVVKLDDTWRKLFRFLKSPENMKKIMAYIGE